jgi:MFS family permease
MDGISLSRPAGVVFNARWITLAALCLAVLVAQVDTAVVNLAVRPIGEYFSAGVQALQWAVDAYNLIYAVLLLTGGQLADLYGRRRIFIAGAAIFTAGSLVCAFAPSIVVLILGRAPPRWRSSGWSGPIRSSAAARSGSGRPATAWLSRSPRRSAAC